MLRQHAYMPRVPGIDWQPIGAYLVAIAAGLFPLERIVMVALAYRLKAVVIAPEQIRVAVVRLQVVDYRCPWMCPAGG